MRKIIVHLNAFACTSVALSVPDDMTDDQILEKAYNKARIEDCEPSDWDVGEEEIVDEEE